MGVGVGLGEADSTREVVAAADVDSSGSTFVKYGELFAATYQSGAASNFFNVLPRGSIVQNSRVPADFSRVKTMLAPSGAKIGAESCPELSFVSCRKSFPSSRYK